MLKVVICGSFHSDSEGLVRVFRELETNACRILSPISLEFSSTQELIVKTVHENDLSIRELELFHLRTLKDADFVWLHSPNGHVGISGSYELGYASALNKPIFAVKCHTMKCCKPGLQWLARCLKRSKQ